MSDVNISVAVDGASAKRGLDSIRKGLSGLTTAGNSVTGSFLKLAAAAGGIAAVVSGIKGIAQTGGNLEQLSNSLNTVFGSVEAGSKAFQTATKVANATGQSIEAMTKAMVQLKGAGVEPSVAQLTAFADAAAVSTDAAGAFEAAVSLVSRTTAGGLGLEELERLGDRGIPVYDIINEKLGLTRLQISEVGKTAQGADRIIQALTDGMAERFGGAALRNATTLGGVMQGMRNSIKLVQKQLFDAGFGRLFKEAAMMVTAFADAFAEMISSSGGLTNDFVDGFMDSIMNVIKAIALGAAGLYDTFGPALKSIFDFIKTGVNNLIDFANTLPTEFRAMGLIGFMMLGAKGKALILIISSMFDGIVDAVSAGLKALVPVMNFVVDLMNDAIDVINKAAGISNKFLGTDFKPIQLIEPFKEEDFDPSDIKKGLKDLVTSIFGEVDQIPLIGEAGNETAVQNVQAFLDRVEAMFAEKRGKLDIVPEPPKEGTGGDEEKVGGFLSGFKSAFDKFRLEAEDTAAYGENIFNTMAQGWTDAIMNFVETGKLSFKDLFRSLLSEIVKMQANRMFLALFSPDGGLFGGVTSAFQSFLGGKQHGGMIPRGKYAITGEAGPELVAGPAYVHSTNATANMMGGRGTTVNYNINAVDAPSFQALVARDPEFIYNVTRVGARRQPG